MNEMLMELYAARDFLRSWCPEAPEVALVLGSGYAHVLAAELDEMRALEYREIPHFPTCTNPNHPGRLVIGELWGRRVAMLQGRIHCYEGYAAERVVFAVRAIALWGASTFVLTNAAGAINPDFHMGEFMAITDHLNFLGQNPVGGHSFGLLGERFPDMSELYTPALIAQALEAAHERGVVLRTGVYAAMQGPSYETPAEIRMLRTLGADAVGMSTVPEAIALGQLGCRVFGLSCLTNLAAGIATHKLDDREITQVLDRPEVQADLKVIMRGVLNAAYQG